ncbi:MAG: hypothetical protein K8T91_26320 [Planctomycetes bacterium]|nr:hypothetical protein [Planctomycetota bacterium]
MVLFILALIVLLTVFAAVATVVMGCILVQRNWHWLRPMVVLGLVLFVSLGLFDAMAVNNSARSAEEAARTQADKDLFGESDQVAANPPQIQLDPEAPEWTRRKSGELFGTTQEVVEVTVHAGPCLSLPDCEAQLARELATAVDDYVRTELGAGPDVQVPRQFVEGTLVKDRYVSRTKKVVVSSLGPQDMVDIYALVKIDRASREKLRDLWRESVVQTRMKTAAAGLAGVLGVLTLGWAVLRRTPKPAGHDVGHRVA